MASVVSRVQSARNQWSADSQQRQASNLSRTAISSLAQHSLAATLQHDPAVPRKTDTEVALGVLQPNEKFLKSLNSLSHRGKRSLLNPLSLPSKASLLHPTEQQFKIKRSRQVNIGTMRSDATRKQATGRLHATKNMKRKPTVTSLFESVCGNAVEKVSVADKTLGGKYATEAR